LTRFELRHSFAILLVAACRDLGTFNQRKEQPSHRLAALAIFKRGRTMASDFNRRADDNSSFSFGVRELQQVELQQFEAAQPLTLDPGPKKAPYNVQGSDPYNSTGSFDLTKSWLRVRKR
jgi:hypothetical protein